MLASAADRGAGTFPYSKASHGSVIRQFHLHTGMQIREGDLDGFAFSEGGGVDAEDHQKREYYCENLPFHNCTFSEYQWPARAGFSIRVWIPYLANIFNPSCVIR